MNSEQASLGNQEGALAGVGNDARLRASWVCVPHVSKSPLRVLAAFPISTFPSYQQVLSEGIPSSEVLDS